MPLNIPGILVPFHLLINPRLVIPASQSEVCNPPCWRLSRELVMLIDGPLSPPLRRTDIRQLDFVALRLRDTEGRS